MRLIQVRTCYLMLLTSLLLSACAVQPPTTNQTRSVTTDNRYFPVAWKIVGKIGIRTPDNSGSLNVVWQQEDKRYLIQTSAALGQGKAILQGTSEQLQIKRPGKSTVYSNNPQHLLKETLGWSLPLEQLADWVLGAPNPETEAHQTYAPDGRLLQMQQAGWSLTYSRYRETGQWLLPHKVIAKQEDNRLTLIIKEWQFDTP